MIIYHDLKQGSEEWLRKRNGKFTGTSSHKLLRFGVIEYSKTSASSFSGNYFTKRGAILEDEAIELYERINNTKVKHAGFIENTKYHNCLYSPDGYTSDTLIEVKCFNTEKHMKMINEIPFSVLAQIHFGLFISELPKAHLIIYNPEIENPKDAFQIIEVKAKKSIQDNFKRILTKSKVLESV